jgi:hypothetical protein
MVKVIKIKETGQYAIPVTGKKFGNHVTVRPIEEDGTIGSPIRILVDAIKVVSLLEILIQGILKLFKNFTKKKKREEV